MYPKSGLLKRMFFTLIIVSAVLHAWPWTPDKCPRVSEGITVDGFDPEWKNIPSEKINDSAYISTVRYEDTLYILVRMDLHSAMAAMTGKDGLKLQVLAGKESFETTLGVDSPLFGAGIARGEPEAKNLNRERMDKGNRRVELTPTEKMNILQFQQIFTQDNRHSCSYFGKSPYLQTGIQYGRYILEYRIPLMSEQTVYPVLAAKTGSKIKITLQSSAPERPTVQGRGMGMDAEGSGGGSPSMGKGPGSGKGYPADMNRPGRTDSLNGLDYKKKWIL